MRWWLKLTNGVGVGEVEMLTGAAVLDGVVPTMEVTRCRFYVVNVGVEVAGARLLTTSLWQRRTTMEKTVT
jgi:hypothetical protein